MLSAVLRGTITNKVVRRGAYAAKTCDESFELFNSGGWVARTQAFVIALPFRLQSLVYDVDCPRYNYDSSYA